MSLSQVLKLPKSLWKECPLSSLDPSKWFFGMNKVEELIKTGDFPESQNHLLTLYEFAVDTLADNCENDFYTILLLRLSVLRGCRNIDEASPLLLLLSLNTPKNARLMIALAFYFDVLNRRDRSETVLLRAKESTTDEFSLMAINKANELLSKGFSLRIFHGLYYYMPSCPGEWAEQMRRYDETHSTISKEYAKSLEPYLDAFREADEKLLASFSGIIMGQFKSKVSAPPHPSLEGINEEEEVDNSATISIKPHETSTVHMDSRIQDESSFVVMSAQQSDAEETVADYRTKSTPTSPKWLFWNFKESRFPFRGAVREDEIDKENTYEALLKPQQATENKSDPQNAGVPKVKVKGVTKPQNPPLTNIDVNSDLISELIETSNVVVGGENFIFLRKIGRGGFSSVYCVMNRERQMRAIKRIELSSDSNEVLKLFQNEVNLLASLRDTNRVINLFKYEITKSELVMVLEFAEQDLKSHLKMRRESGALTDQFMVFIWSEMLACVKVIHDRRIIHLDLKPENFVIVNGMLKLIDLGISQRLPVDCTHMDLQRPMGSLIYMSPEQLASVIKGHVAEAAPGRESKMRLKTDVWALGAILFEIIHGRALFGRINQAAIIIAIIAQSPINFPPVQNPILDLALKRCLVREVDQRTTVDELLSLCFPKLT